jgi:SAM-dependent methyltransferase
MWNDRRVSAAHGESALDATLVEVNEALWSTQDLVRDYSGRTLRPAEVLLLVEHREALRGRVLELGCGGGRLSGYLVELSQDFHGLDISPLMVAHCRRLYPAGRFEVRDLRELADYPDRGFDVVFASYNVLDVLDDAGRRRVLADINGILAADGLLIMSSHNLAFAPSIPKPTSVRAPDPLRLAREMLRVPRRVRNHRRLRELERIADDHAILIDEAHDYAILHYYIGRDIQERQLASLGFELIGCLDLDGHSVAHGEPAAHAPELHYVARRRRAPAPSPDAAG